MTEFTKFILNIEMGNDAMRTGRDLADAIHRVADSVDGDGPPRVGGCAVRDGNGNLVGDWRIDNE